MLDTPGVMLTDHVSHLLTPDEQRAVSPASCVPKVHTLRRGQSLLFGGLARVDYVDGDEDHIIVTAFAAPTVHVRTSPLKHCMLLRSIFAPCVHFPHESAQRHKLYATCTQQFAALLILKRKYI